MKSPTQAFWEDAYQNNIGRLIAICFRYTQNHQLSQDLAHDAFLKAIDKFDTFKGDGPFGAWLRRIAVNHTLQYFREQKKNPFADDLLPDAEPAEAREENVSLIDAMDFTTEELNETIDQLPEKHRVVFNLFVLDEFTHVQIGKELGISEGTSKSHLSRARKKLRSLLIRKAERAADRKDSRKALLLVSAKTADETVDRVFQRSFDNFSIPSAKPFCPPTDAAVMGGVAKRNLFHGSRVVVIITSSVAAIVAVISVASIKKKDLHSRYPVQAVAPVAASPKLANSSPDTATFSKNGVTIKRNLKQQPMKPLDTLALILTLSSLPKNTAIARDSFIHAIERSGSADASVLPDSARDASLLPAVFPPEKTPTERGTFRASELFWSDQNRELYLKGKVRVDFGNEHFHGNGSFTFLNKVYLLVVDGQPAAPGKTLKLADVDYELLTLDNKEAVQKYGSKGSSGAVEIVQSPAR